MIYSTQQAKSLMRGSFGTRFNRAINSHLRELYSANYGILEDEDCQTIEGIIDIEGHGERWSLLNRINTNYIALQLILNRINEVLKTYNKNPLDVNIKADEEKFFEYLDRYKANFLTREGGYSDVFESILRYTKWMRDKGKENENIAIEHLKKCLGNRNYSLLCSGDKRDLYDGVDVVIDRKETVQVKPYITMEELENGYFFDFKGGRLRNYPKVDYYFLLGKNSSFLFKNVGNPISTDNYFFPIDSLVCIT